MPLISPPHSKPLCLLALHTLLCWHGVSWLSPLPGYAADVPVEIELRTVPAPGNIRPDDEVVTVTLSARLQGKPLSGGHLTLQLTAPPRSTVLTTDFPHVEGTPLLALASDLPPDGTLTLQYVFPIRGVYTFALQVEPVPGGPTFRPTSLSRTLKISENPEEVRNAWIFVAGLFIFGGIVGRILARSAAAREAVQTAPLLVLCLLTGGLLVTGSPMVSAQEHAHTAAASPGAQSVQGTAGWELSVQPSSPSATVGQLLAVDIVLRKNGQVWPHPLEVSLGASGQEDSKEIFQTTLRTQAGQSTPRLQFFDGAPHNLTVTARPLAGTESEMAPLTVSMGLEVQALHPPMRVKLRLMALFMVILASGIVLGFFCPGRFKEPRSA